jgi:hypothetical protein
MRLQISPNDNAPHDCESGGALCYPEDSELNERGEMNFDPRRILEMRMQPNDAGAETIRDYLITLLARVWELSDDFSGKRPFGMSGWVYELYIPLMTAGLISGKLDEDGYVVEMDTDAGDRIIAAAIQELRAAE